jgi:hypothetical protein
MSHVHRDKKVERKPAAIYPPSEGSGPDPAALDDAAEALRAVEVEAVDPEPHPDREMYESRELESLNIDELRRLAKELDVPDRETITESDELIAAIRQRI